MLTLHLFPFDPMAIIDEVCEVFRYQAEMKRVSIVCKASPFLALPGEESIALVHLNENPERSSDESYTKIPKLLGDKRRFKQVVMNLLKNAIKFTQEGTIEIKASYRRAPENLLIINITDSGVGIADEDFPMLFNRFGKLQRTADINSAGIGLGLFIVKSIVESCGGQVGVESDGIGLGSTFKFSLLACCVDSDVEIGESG